MIDFEDLQEIINYSNTLDDLLRDSYNDLNRIDEDFEYAFIDLSSAIQDFLKEIKIILKNNNIDFKE